MKRVMLSGVLLSLLLAPSTGKADDAFDRLKLAEQVVVMARVADNLRQIMPMTMAQMKPLVEKQGSADFAEFDKLFKARVPAAADQFAEKMARIYAVEFSAADLSNLLVFYKTQTGQNLLSRQAVIAQASFAIGQQFGQDLVKQVLEDIDRDKATPKL